MKNNNNAEYICKQLFSGDIESDLTYQRNVDMKRVKNIATHFNPNLVNLIKVSKRDGKYYVFDGQHTLAALKLRNGNRDLQVDCKVYVGLTQQEEAKLFSDQNGISRTVGSIDKMKALYTAGDVDVIELHNAINSLGIKFDFTKGKGHNKIIACNTVYSIFKKTTGSEFRTILHIVKESWGGDQESYNKEILGGMYILYTTYKKQIDINKAINQFSKVSPREIIREGRLAKEGGDKRFARQLVIVYNKKLRGQRLDESL